MTRATATVVYGVIVEETVHFTLVELSRACRVDRQLLAGLVAEGVLTPTGNDEASWLFDGSALRRARSALRLARDLQLDADNAGFVLDLLDEIKSLKMRLSSLGGE